MRLVGKTGTVYSVPKFSSHPENVGAASGREYGDSVISIAFIPFKA